MYSRTIRLIICELIILDARDSCPSDTPQRSAVSSPATILLIASGEYNSDNGAFLSSPTGSFDQAVTYFDEFKGLICYL